MKKWPKSKSFDFLVFYVAYYVKHTGCLNIGKFYVQIQMSENIWHANVHNHFKKKQFLSSKIHKQNCIILMYNQCKRSTHTTTSHSLKLNMAAVWMEWRQWRELITAIARNTYVREQNNKISHFPCFQVLP